MDYLVPKILLYPIWNEYKRKPLRLLGLSSFLNLFIEPNIQIPGARDKYPTKCFTILWPEKSLNQSLRESNNVNQSLRESNTTQHNTKTIVFRLKPNLNCFLFCFFVFVFFLSNKPAPKCETFGQVVSIPKKNWLAAHIKLNLVHKRLKLPCQKGGLADWVLKEVLHCWTAGAWTSHYLSL